MSGYEDEHNIQKDAAPQQHTHRRPDLSTFFSTLELVDTSSSTNQPHNNANADPIPANVSSAYRQLANSYQIIMGESEGVYTPEGQERERSSNALLENMVSLLMQGANDPPTRPHGMPEEYFDQLERIPKKQLKKIDSCPICSNPFLEDKYPLVVQLPCHKDHIFDLECIKPWLKLNTTCPLDRVNLEKKKEVPKPAPKDDDEGEWDEMYA